VKKVAIIAAAGWWGCGCLMDPAPPFTQDLLKPLAGCPEALLPLGNGETVLSRLARQLKELSYEVYIGVGEPGCLWDYGIRDRIKFLGERGLTEIAREFGHSKSPWNRDKVEYCKQFGKVVEIPDPDNWGKHRTFLRILEGIDEPFELIMLICGDSLFTNALIEEIDSRGSHIFFTEHDEVFVLNKAGVEIWKDIIQKKQKIQSTHYPIWYRTGSVVEEQFEAAGVPYLYMTRMKETYPRERWDEQIDIDFPDFARFSTYIQALKWMDKYSRSEE